MQPSDFDAAKSVVVFRGVNRDVLLTGVLRFGLDAEWDVAQVNTMHVYEGLPAIIRSHSIYPVVSIEVLFGRFNPEGDAKQTPTLEIVR